MHALLKRWTDALMKWAGVDAAAESGWDRLVAFILVVAVAVVLDFVLRKIVVRGVRRIVERTRVRWDDELFSVRVLDRGCHILSALLLVLVLPVVFEDKTEVRTFVLRMVEVYAIVTVILFINALLFAAFRIAAARPAWQNKPIKGLRQTAQGIVLFIGVIFCISTLMGKSPANLLTGLGASAAVMMLIFRDSILGFVSGIQLSANDMLKVGDWISVPKSGADGKVEEVSLTTVKIRNFDNTIVTLPPYLLVSDSFVNWHAMQLTGGRRVMRSVSIDMTSVRFCTPELLQRLRGVELLNDYIDRAASADAAQTSVEELPVEARHATNLGLLRLYIVRYLSQKVPVNRSMTLMVRELQPTESGIPLQLYFFTDTVVWVEYERIQADVFDHLLAVIPEFGLRVFQNPTGRDFQELQRNDADAPSNGFPSL